MFLPNEVSEKLEKLGFYTTRWVRAGSRTDAGRLACRIVRDELLSLGAANPPEQPLRVSAEDVIQVSWLEALRQGHGTGFTFYPDGAG